jgi:uncharacterized protein
MLEKLVAFCLRWPWTVVLFTLALTGGGVYLTIERFAIDTDTTNLFSPSVAWRKNQIALYRAFPQLENSIVVVIDAQTGAAADDAAARLTADLKGKPLMQRVWRPDDPTFFAKNGLLYLDLKEVEHTVGMMLGQRDVLTPLAEDPTLRGLSGVLVANQKRAAGSERATAMYLAGLDEFSRAFEETLAGAPAQVDWEKLLSGGKDDAPVGPPLETRRIVMVSPVIDFSELQPGADAMAYIRSTAEALGLTKEKGFTVRLTGEVPLAAEEFATLSENMTLNTVGTLVVVSLILFAALRSPKLILAVLATLLAGLAMTSGMGVLLIGRFNLISVAFAALFIGLGVDFGIQFATRYREERHGHGDLEGALLAATRGIGGSLTLAAVSLLAGFFCFLPTNFLGVAELGLIAGVGMIIAYLATLTFLPAAIKLLHPPAEHVPIATHSLAAVDHWIAHHRVLVLVATAAVVLAGAPYLMRLRFDSNPMNLRDQTVESVATFLDLTKDPRTAPNKIETLAPSLAAARDLKQKILALPEVDHVDSIDSLIPADQDEKLALLERASNDLRAALYPTVKPAPTDAETVKALAAAAKSLRATVGKKKPAPQVTRFAAALDSLAKASPETREKARAAVFTGFEKILGQLRDALKAQRVTPESMPEELRADWISAKGQVRLETTPKGDSNNLEVMTRFADAMLEVAPESSGAPIIVSEAGKTVTRAFLEAGVYAFLAIFLILVIALRNPVDVALTLGPLVLAGIMSLQAAEILGVSLNFANIIALPLMFGVGVAFHIYYVIAWRKGIVDMLASSLTRAIFFSSLTTGTAFGSLFLSSHPGTASMGEFLTISLFFTLLAAFIIVPAFLGPPKHTGADAT